MKFTINSNIQVKDAFLSIILGSEVIMEIKYVARAAQTKTLGSYGRSSWSSA